MKVSPGFRVIGLLALGLYAIAPKAQGQGIGISVTGSASNIAVNDPVTYTILVTNLTFTALQDVLVTNTLPSSVSITGATASQGISFVNGSVVSFDLGQLQIGQGGFVYATMTVTAQPTVAGIITVNVTGFDAFTGNSGSAFTTTVVTNASPTLADLAVSLTPPTQAVIANDFVGYGITVSNLGPNDAPGVIVTNSLAGMKFLTNSPGNLSRTFSGSNVLFNLGTLTNGAVTNFSVRVQPLNVGPLTLLASVGSPDLVDTNTANNTASNNIIVGAYLSTNLVITLVSTQSFDSLDGLMEQMIAVSNAGPSSADSSRVVVSGLTNQLFNAVGTNNGNPFVVHGAPLGSNQSINLLLQYFVPTHRAVPVTLQAFGIPAFDLTPPSPAGTPIGGLQILQLPAGTSLPGSMAVSFPSISNQAFTVIYSDNMAFSNAFAAQPSVKAFANQTIWFDYGPPATVSHPTNAPMRFYQVFLNP